MYVDYFFTLNSATDLNEIVIKVGYNWINNITEKNQQISKLKILLSYFFYLITIPVI